MATKIKKPAKKKNTGTKKVPHRPPHVPTDETRSAVRALAAMGTQQLEICKYLSEMMGAECASKQTLAKHYKNELELAKTHQKLMVTQGLYRKAVGSAAQYDDEGNLIRNEIKPEVTAQIFWLKCQAGWVEPSRFAPSGGAGGGDGMSLEELIHASYTAGKEAKTKEPLKEPEK